MAERFSDFGRSASGAMQRLWAGLGRSTPVLLALGVAVAAIWPALVAPGLVATRAAGDSPFLLQRTFEMAQALSSGHFPPRWMPDAAFGLGYPFWNFYGPLAYLIGGTLAAAGASVVGAVKVSWLLVYLAGALGAYRLGVLTWRRPVAGLVASASYTLAPYHLVNVYVRGDALSELLAYGLAPWVLVAVHGVFGGVEAGGPSAGAGDDRGLGTTRTVEDFATTQGRGVRSILSLSTSLALLLVAHNITALLAAPVVAAYALWRWLGERHRPLRPAPIAHAVESSEPRAPRVSFHRSPWGWPAQLTIRLLLRLEASPWRARLSPRFRGLGLLAMGGLLGLGLAAWFWLPALAEGRHVQLGQNLTGYFHYAGHWRSWPSLVSLALPFDYAPGEDCAPCRAGLVQVVLAMLGVAMVLWRGTRGELAARTDRSAAAFWGAVALGTTLLMTAISGPLWETLPLLAYAQFPWRWLGMQALALSILAGGMVAGGAPVLGPRANPPLGPFVASTEPAAPASQLLDRFEGWRGRLIALAAMAALMASMLPGLHVDVLAVREVTRDDLTTFELFSGNIGSTVRAEYLPAEVAPRPLAASAAVWGRPGAARAVDGTGDIAGATLLRRGAAWQEWQVRLRSAATVAFPVYWFPGWEVQVQDGAWRPASRVDGSGWIKVALEPADCPPDDTCRVLLRLGRSGVRAVAEGLSLVAILAWLALWLADRRRRIGEAAARVLVLVAASVALAYVLPQGTASGPITVDLNRSPYPHANPGGVSLGRARLVGASLRTPFGELNQGAGPSGGPAPSDQSALAPPAPGAAQVTPGQPLTVNLTWQGLAAGTRVEAALVSPAEAMFGVPYVIASDERRAPEVNSFSLQVPAETPAGLYFVRLKAFEGRVAAGGADDSGATDVLESGEANDKAMGTTYLGPVRITSSGFAGPTDALAIMGDVWLLELGAKLESEEAPARRVVVDMTWRAVRALPVDYQTSVRLVDRAGKTLAAGGVDAQEDKQPGYGFLPTTTWPAGEAIQDRRWVVLPEGIRPEQVEGIEVVLYDVASAKEIGRAKTGMGR